MLVLDYRRQTPHALSPAPPGTCSEAQFLAHSSCLGPCGYITEPQPAQLPSRLDPAPASPPGTCPAVPGLLVSPGSCPQVGSVTWTLQDNTLLLPSCPLSPRCPFPGSAHSVPRWQKGGRGGCVLSPSWQGRRTQIFCSFFPDCSLPQLRQLQGRPGRNVPPPVCLGETSQPRRWAALADGPCAVPSLPAPAGKQSSAQISCGKVSRVPNEAEGPGENEYSSDVKCQGDPCQAVHSWQRPACALHACER